MKNLENFLKTKKGKIQAWLCILLVAVLAVVLVVGFKLIQRRNSELLDNQIETGTRIDESDERTNQESNLNEYNLSSGDEEFDDSDHNEYAQLPEDSYEIDEDTHIVSFNTDEHIPGFKISDNPERPEDDDNWYDVEDNQPVEILDTDVHKKYVYYLATTYYSISNKTTKYSTLKDALSNVSSGGTITVDANVTDSSAVTIGKSVTLNTNGKTLTRTATITNNSTLNITGSGTITTKATASNSLQYLITNTGTLNLTSATLQNYGCASKIWRVISSTAGNITLNSGNVKALITSGASSSEYGVGIVMTGNTNLTMKSGSTVYTNGPNKSGTSASWCILSNPGSTGTVTLSGGTVNSTTGGGIEMNGTSSSKNGAKLSITSGTVTALRNAIYTNYTTNTITISGGSITSTELYGLFQESTGSSAITISGGTLTGYDGVRFDGTGSITIGTSGGSVSTSSPKLVGTSRYGLNDSKSFNFYDGIFEGKTAAYTGTLSGHPDHYHITSGTDGSYKTAYLTLDTYTVSYNANGGSGAPSNQTKTYGVNLTLSSTKPTKTGYTFSKWNTNTSATGTSYNPGGTYSGNAALTLYAIWTANKYTIKYNQGTATGGTLPSAQTATYDVNITLGTNSMTKSNTNVCTVTFNYNGSGASNTTGNVYNTYAVNGWSTSSGGSRSYTSGQSVKNLTSTSGGTFNLYPCFTATAHSPTFPSPSRTGYTFDGWYTAASGGSKVTSYTGSSNVTYYAHWTEKTATLTYNANGHGTAPSNVIMKYTTATNAASAITATGYTFSKWNTKSDGTGTSYNAGAQVKAANTEPSATTLYAIWTEKTATLTYNANGHGTAPSNVTMKYTTATNAASAITGVTGYTFSKWNTKSDGTGTSYDAGAEVKAVNTEPSATTLYAIWTINKYYLDLNYNLDGNGQVIDGTSITKGPYSWSVVINGGTATTGTEDYYKQHEYNSTYEVTITPYAGYTTTTPTFSGTIGAENVSLTVVLSTTTYDITYILDGGTNNTSNPSTYNVRTPDITLADASKTGYTFIGWTGNGTTTPTKNLKLEQGSTGDKTYTANWSANQYTVSFDANGGSGGQTEDVIATYDSVMPIIDTTAPTRTGYTFMGWYDNATYSNGTQYYTAEGGSARNWDKTSGATLYAGWEANSYIIRFDGNGSTDGSMADLDMTYDVEKELTENSFSRIGYSFTGWNTNASGTGTSFSDKQRVKNLATSGIATLYAQWSANDYTVTYQFCGGILRNPSSMENIIFSASVEETYDSKYKLTTIPSRPGFTFVGWYTEESSGEQVTTDTTVKITSAQTLYAHWNKNNYTITINPNGGTWGDSTLSQSFTQEYGTTKTIEDPTSEDSVFKGWALTKQINGETFVELLYQAPGYAGFENEDGAKSANELYKFSQLGQLERFRYNGGFEFAILADENGKYYHWSQTSNPLTSTEVTGYNDIDNGFGGLVYKNNTTLLGESTSSENNWASIGQYEGTVSNPISNADNLYTYRPIHFYVKAGEGLSNLYTNFITGSLNNDDQYIFRDEDVTLTAMWARKNYKVGDSYWQTFEDAYNALSSSGGTIKLEKGIVEEKVVPIEKTINLDLQNSEMTLNGVQLVVNGIGNLTIVGGEGGKITKNDGTPIVNNSGFVRIGSDAGDIKNYPIIEGNEYAIEGGFNFVGGTLMGTNNPPYTGGAISLAGRNYTEIITDEQNGKYESRVRVEIVPPTIEIEANTIEPTNQDVTLTVRVTDNYSGVEKVEYTLDTGKYELSIDANGYGTIVVTHNQRVRVDAEDRAGNKSVEYYNVENIDKHPEEINSADIEGAENGIVSTITVVFKDIRTTDDANVRKIFLSNTNQKPNEDSVGWVPYDANVRVPWVVDYVDGNGEKIVYMWVMDIAKNISTVAYEKHFEVKANIIKSGDNKVRVSFMGVDDNILKTTLQNVNVAFKGNDELLTMDSKAVEIIDNDFEYEGKKGIKFLATLVNATGAGRIIMTIDEDTLYDKAGNKNIRQVLETNYYMDTNPPSISIDENGVATVTDLEGNLSAVTVNGVLVSRDGTGIGVIPIGATVKAYDKAGNVSVATR